MLSINLEVPLQHFTLALEWSTSATSLGIFGPSGAGKTTILEALAGLRQNARGLIEVNGKTWLDSRRGVNLPPHQRGVGYVPQDVLLFPHRDVLGNVLSGRRRANRCSESIVEPRRVLEVLDIAKVQSRNVQTLSGGEKQRVALARALCSGPELLLLDEPLAGLDVPLRRRILPYLVRVRDEFGIPTMHVSHDAAEVRTLCDEVTVLAEGRAIARGNPDDVLTGSAILPMVRGESLENVFRGRVVELDESSATVELEPGLHLMVSGAGLAMGQTAIIGVRAEDFILALGTPSGLSAQNVLTATLVEIQEAPEAGGPVWVVASLGRAASRAVAAVTRQACSRLDLHPGMPVHLVCKASACRVLAAGDRPR